MIWGYNAAMDAISENWTEADDSLWIRTEMTLTQSELHSNGKYQKKNKRIKHLLFTENTNW